MKLQLPAWHEVGKCIPQVHEIYIRQSLALFARHTEQSAYLNADDSEYISPIERTLA